MYVITGSSDGNIYHVAEMVPAIEYDEVSLLLIISFFLTVRYNIHIAMGGYPPYKKPRHALRTAAHYYPPSYTTRALLTQSSRTTRVAGDIQA